MYTTKEGILSSINRTIEYKKRELAKAELIPIDEVHEYFGEAGQWSTTYSELQYTLPFDKVKYLPLIEKWCIENNFVQLTPRQYIWDETKTLNSKPSAGLFIDCYDKNDTTRKFEFALRTGTDGDNCSIKAIGKKEVAIYEITCKDDQ